MMPRRGLEGAAEESLFSKGRPDAYEEGEEDHRDGAEAFGAEETFRDLSYLLEEIRLQDGEEGVKGERDQESADAEQGDDPESGQGDGTVAKPGEGLPEAAPHTDAHAAEGDDHQGQLAEEDDKERYPPGRSQRGTCSFRLQREDQEEYRR